MTIGEAAQRTGISASAIRYYESERILPAPRRVSGRRVYDERILDLLAVIEMAKRSGFSVTELRQLMAPASGDTASARWHSLAQRKAEDLDEMIATAQAMKKWLEKMKGCRCVDFEQCGRNLRSAAQP